MRIGVVVTCFNEGEYVDMTLRGIKASLTDEHTVDVAWVADHS